MTPIHRSIVESTRHAPRNSKRIYSEQLQRNCWNLRFDRSDVVFEPHAERTIQIASSSAQRMVKLFPHFPLPPPN
jgi:hypothetical protein